MNKTIKRITGDGLMLAVYIVLSILTIKITPNLQIAFTSLAIIITCVVYGFVDGIVVAFLGSFVGQLTSTYGLTITTPIWMIPPILRAVVFGLAYELFLNHGVRLENKKILFFTFSIIAGLVVTAANTLAIWLDAVILEMPVEFVVVETVLRFVSSILSSIAMTFLSIPIIFALQNANLIDDRNKKEVKEETVLAYIEKDDSYLLLYRNKKKKDINKNKWVGIGGHLEKDETPIEALKREIKEETNLDVIDYEYKGIVHFNNENCSEIMHLFVVKDYSGSLGECDEGELKFVPKNEIFNLPIWEGDKIFLQYLFNDEPYFELELNYKGDELLSYERIK